jgi:hypothetical protein
MKIRNRSEMVEMLRERICVVKFTKVDGEPREMSCTLNEKVIPDSLKPKDGSTKYSEEVIKVFDINKAAWRSFKVNSVQSFEYIVS